MAGPSNNRVRHKLEGAPRMKSRGGLPTGSQRAALGAPFLRRVVTLPERIDPGRYPFNVRAFSRGIDLTFRTNVTFFVGENGSGKSTLLEAIAECCGFNPEGGNRDHHREAFADRSELAQALRLSWLPKVAEGFFMRAESFYNFATYIEKVSDLRAYGGKSLHAAVARRVFPLPVRQPLRAGDLHSRTSPRPRSHRNDSCRF